MGQDVLFAGLFGVFSTLIGGLATYMLSFSRDQRLEKAEFKVIYSSLVADLRAIRNGFEKDKEYIPRFSSFNVFKMKGGYGYAPSEVCVALENLSYELTRIEDITKEDVSFKVAVASTGNTNLRYNNGTKLKERKELLEGLNEKLDKTVALLQKQTF
ncbi:hypothetical protein L4D11_22595 [Vibrio gigantis]|uniref:hypothetical protein n=1 Tax=Vibrio gigantis TaxID=296199 RepID=UPI003D112CC0